MSSAAKCKARKGIQFGDVIASFRLGLIFVTSTTQQLLMKFYIGSLQ